MSSEDSERPLMSEEEGRTEKGYWHRNTWCTHNLPIYQKKPAARTIIFYAFIALPWLLLAGLGFWSLPSLRLKSSHYIVPKLAYSPLEDILEYETKIFTTGFPEDHDFSGFAQEPSPEVDALWKTLYPSIIQLLPQEKAAKLVNKTIIFPHDPQRRYAIELDVFHQLHCLNMVRKATRPDYYKPDIAEGETEDEFIGHKHIAHCIDAIRQSLMCSSDITPYTWQWSEEKGHPMNNVKYPHVCRNFDKIRKWATDPQNTIREYMDASYREMNDPLDPSTWVDGYVGE